MLSFIKVAVALAVYGTTDTLRCFAFKMSDIWNVCNVFYLSINLNGNIWMINKPVAISKQQALITAGLVLSNGY